MKHKTPAEMVSRTQSHSCDKSVWYPHSSKLASVPVHVKLLAQTGVTLQRNNYTLLSKLHIKGTIERPTESINQSINQSMIHTHKLTSTWVPLMKQ